MSEVAIATHKRYLGRPELLTGIQSARIKSLLTVWGKVREGRYTHVSPQHTLAGGQLRGEMVR